MSTPEEVVRRVHREISRTATGGVVDPRGARALMPPSVSSAPSVSSVSSAPDAGRVLLPAGVPLPEVGLGAALAARRSSYDLGGAQPPLPVLAALLRGALGPQRTVTLRGVPHTFATSPSAGGLPSLDTYVVARGAGDLPVGVHRLARDCSALDPVRRGDPTAFVAAALDQPEWADRAGVVVALVARLDTTLVRYPPRHYRTLHLDAGVALQSLWLVATALGLPACALSGYDDDAWDALLEVGEAGFTAVLLALAAAPAPV